MSDRRQPAATTLLGGRYELLSLLAGNGGNGNGGDGDGDGGNGNGRGRGPR